MSYKPKTWLIFNSTQKISTRKSEQTNHALWIKDIDWFFTHKQDHSLTQKHQSVKFFDAFFDFIYFGAKGLLPGWAVGEPDEKGELDGAAPLPEFDSAAPANGEEDFEDEDDFEEDFFDFDALSPPPGV